MNKFRIRIFTQDWVFTFCLMNNLIVTKRNKWAVFAISSGTRVLQRSLSKMYYIITCLLFVIFLMRILHSIRSYNKRFYKRQCRDWAILRKNKLCFVVENLRKLTSEIYHRFLKEHIECSLRLAPQTCKIKAAPEGATRNDNH